MTALPAFLVGIAAGVVLGGLFVAFIVGLVTDET